MYQQFNEQFAAATRQFADTAAQINRIALENAEAVFGLQLSALEERASATFAFFGEVAEARDLDAAKTLFPKGVQVARENVERLHAHNVRLLHSDLFHNLDGEVYDLIVTNPPYVTHAETDALPAEYKHEPELGLRAGDDGLDLALEILRDAPAHLSEHGLLICEVGEAERALVELLPEVPMAWVEFKVGQMGIFVVERQDLVEHHARIKALADAR